MELTGCMQNTLSSIIPGSSRVRDKDGFCGTIEYVGPVASAKNENEIYAGISWDDPSRGKHDGSVICRRTQRLVRHFSCKGGSFMRISKLDLGVPLDLSLIRAKYVELSAPLIAPGNILPNTARTTTGKEKSIEFYGEIKIREVQQPEFLQRISLRNMGVSSISPELSGFENLQELDLGGNLLSEWDFISVIPQIFPILNSLNVASNRIGDLKKLPEIQINSITELNLNSCGINSFMTVEVVDKVFPELKRLYLAYNDLSNLSEMESLVEFQKLLYLDVSSCKLTSWCDQVNKLSRISGLKSLILNDNDINKVLLNEDGTVLQNIEHISLTGTSISEWAGMQDITLLPGLISLSLRNTPLTSSMGTAEARFNLIARCPNIQILNSSPVSEKERHEAERRYVSQVTQELLLLNGLESKEDILKKQHSQFNRLSEKFYADMQRQCTINGLAEISPYTVNITIASMAAGSCHMDSIQKRLPSSLTVGRLKALCLRTFGLDIDLQILHYHTSEDAFPTELREDSYTLAYYGVEDGGNILMNELNLKSLQENEEMQQNVQEKSIAKQVVENNIVQGIKREIRENGFN